jgi:hypothetical protein
VVGRITEEHLGEAEKSFPGIGRMYRTMSDKPTTFLQLVWRYEAIAATGRAPRAASRPRRALRV